MDLIATDLVRISLPIIGLCADLSFKIIPQREMRSISNRGPIVFTYVYPPKGDTRYLTMGGPIDTLSIFCPSERILDFQNIPLEEVFLKP